MRTIKFRVYDNIYNIIIDDYDLWAYVERYKNNLRVPPNYYLMQYTGIDDKNGEPIYEWDIVQVDDRKGEVIYSVDRFCVKNIIWLLLSDNMEVIGNIYENPELMNGKN
jgi:uncharacterized phage protein (TIGR01671 family)